MSTSRFYREHAVLMRSGTPADHGERVREAYDAVRDKWIAEQRYLELVRAITANWTAGNCVAYMAPLSRVLAGCGETEWHRHLWTRTIKRQVDRCFHALACVEPGKGRFLRLLNLDTRGFIETEPSSYRDGERAAAFLLQRLVGDLDAWRDELRAAGLATDDPDRIGRSLQKLKRPRIRVNTLPPVKVSRPTPHRGAD